MRVCCVVERMDERKAGVEEKGTASLTLSLPCLTFTKPTAIVVSSPAADVRAVPDAEKA